MSAQLFKGMNVLFIEDDQAMVDIWKLALEHAVVCESVATEKEAKALFDSRAWDIVVLDGELDNGGLFGAVLAHIKMKRGYTGRIIATSKNAELRAAQLGLGCTDEVADKAHVPRKVLALLAQITHAYREHDRALPKQLVLARPLIPVMAV
jgi:DNA-binding response OmpR family regulator